MHMVSSPKVASRRTSSRSKGGEDAAAGRADRVSEGDAGAVDIEGVRFVVHAPFGRAGQDLSSKGFVEFDQIEILEFEAGPFEGFGRRRHRTDTHTIRLDAGEAPRPELGQRSEPEISGHLGMGDQTDGGAVVLPAGVAGRDRSLRVRSRHDRTKRGQGLEGSVGSGMLIALDYLFAPAGRDANRHEFVGEDAFTLGAHGPLMRTQREGVLTLPRDLVVTTEVLGRFYHSAGHGIVTPPGRDPTPGQSVDQFGIAGPGTPSGRRRVVLDLAHTFRPACDDDITGAGLDAHGRINHGLQTRTAATVELQARSGHR